MILGLSDLYDEHVILIRDWSKTHKSQGKQRSSYKLYNCVQSYCIYLTITYV